MIIQTKTLDLHLMRYSRAEENYLKAIYKLSRVQMNDVSTKAIGELLQIKPPTVSDMLKKLAVKKLANYEKYKGVSLTQKGELHALKVIRKHRLWETFLVEKLDFTWDKVHDIAEQLEHIHSTDLVNRLDKFLNFPKFDPHGDPIPDENGVIELRHEKTLDSIANGSTAVMVGASLVSFLTMEGSCPWSRTSTSSPALRQTCCSSATSASLRMG